MYIPTLLYGSESWTVLNKHISSREETYEEKCKENKERYNKKYSNQKGLRTGTSKKILLIERDEDGMDIELG